MATLVLQAAGQSVGTFLGGPLGGIVGRAVGAFAGQAIDGQLFGAKAREVEGPRVSDLQVQASSEGSPIPRIFGRGRLAGQIIWATNFEEEISTRTEKSGGKGSSGGTKTKITEYAYYANFAVGLCEGPITRIGRIWADGKLLDQSVLTIRLYKGSETQTPDSLIETKEGAGNTPAYRGLAYVVFDRMPLERFGNRLPQLSFEVFKSLDDIESRITSVNIIPGTTEFGYDTTEVTRSAGAGVTLAENRHTTQEQTDWSVAIDQLQATCPNLTSVSLVVTWFGTDLRCANCDIKPGVENRAKITTPESWLVAGETRNSAHLVSVYDNRPAFGGTPTDASVIRAIQDLKSRGLKVTLYPFLIMDIPAGNALNDPYTGNSGQPVYPWRGEITCSPAPGVSGTVDKTAAATSQISSFFGTSQVSDYSTSSGVVTYSGPVDWSIRRMILHYANLCALAGGVDTFLISSELRNLTQVRDSAVNFPAVNLLATLAGDVKSVLGGQTKVSYAADWSEYFGYQPQDGSNDVLFHLDGLWANSSIDFIGIDNYMPLSDWRDGDNHIDRQNGARSIYDRDYLKSNIAGGEGYDWYYASDSDRTQQVRTAITDGTYSKPWVFRYKDITNWWQNSHYNRPGGIEDATATAWQPQSKPIVFTEFGCPAIDNGTNQPNVFFDAKSSSSAAPYFSSASRDDFIQRRYLEAMLDYWGAGKGGVNTTNNPTSSVYGGSMVDFGTMSIWTWDARPFPAFPFLTSIWSDGDNWERGHWLSGRLGAVALEPLVRTMLEQFGFDKFDVSNLEGIMDGFVIDRPMSVRAALEPLGRAFFFDAVESEGVIRFRHRNEDVTGQLVPDDLVVESADDKEFTLTRAQETELPNGNKIGYIDSLADYRRASVEARRLVGRSQRQSTSDMPIVMAQSKAQSIADILLQEAWAGREKADFTLPPSLLRFEPGDLIDFNTGQNNLSVRLQEVGEAEARNVSALSAVATIYSGSTTSNRTTNPGQPLTSGLPLVEFMDLPQLIEADNPEAGYVAAYAEPWPGGLNLMTSSNATSFELNRRIDVPAVLGETLEDLNSGSLYRMDRGNRFQVRIYSGALSSVDQLGLFAGANIAAILNQDGQWEMLQFQNADLVGVDTYELSMLLRGQQGTELAMRDPVPAGQRFVLIDNAVVQPDLLAGQAALSLTYRIGPPAKDVGDPAYLELVKSFPGRGQKPFSPAHVKALRTGSGVQFSWIRRTRLGGDDWQQVEVPLSEELEAYEIDILSAQTVVRTLYSQQPQIIYTSAEEIADWATPQSQLDIAVYQISTAFGRGSANQSTVDVQ